MGLGVEDVSAPQAGVSLADADWDRRAAGLPARSGSAAGVAAVAGLLLRLLLEPLELRFPELRFLRIHRADLHRVCQCMEL